MTIADRIQSLRKSKGITQEELADRIGVSRQAVSKWESEQSLPEVDKIILLSEFFETTTDYLLKGIEPVKGMEEKPENEPGRSAVLFAIGGTALNAAGLLAAVFIWIEQQVTYATGVGLFLMLLGTTVFLAGQFQNTKEKEKAKRVFLFPNVWILLFIPLSCVFNLLCALRSGSFFWLIPVPQLSNPIILYGLFWMGYIVLCVAVSGGMAEKMHKHRPEEV